MTEHQEKMLDHGWLAVRDLSGEIVEWRDPTAARWLKLPCATSIGER